MSEEIKRAVGLLIIEAVNSNPNGDPDRESDPRQRANGLGEISPVSFKRKLRDLVECKDQPVFVSLKNRLQLDDGCFEILESRDRAERSVIINEMQDAGKDFMKSTFVRKYWDARIFGNTFLESNKDKGKSSEESKDKKNTKSDDIKKNTIKTGVVQFGMGISVKPIEVIRQTNTNKAGVEEGKDRGMAPLAYRVVTHAVYCMPFFVNPTYAPKSGCTRKDIDLMKALIPYAYDHTRSAIRPDVRIRHAWYIEHKNALGSCPDYLLIEALTPRAKVEKPVSWSDYDVPNQLPEDLRSRIESITDLMNGF